MKLFAKIALVTAVSAIALSANASINYSNNAQTGKPYIGVKVGQVDVDNINKKATSYGVYGGYEFGNGFSAEAEYMGSSDTKFSSNIQNLEYNVKTYGAYGAYRYNFDNTPFFVKGKLGVAHTKLTASTTGYSASNNDTGLAYGVGAGYAPNQNFAIEAEYNRIADNANTITLGAVLKF